MNTVCRSLAMVLVGSVVEVAEVDADVVEAPEVAVDADDDTLAWRSTNSFCKAELKLDPLVLVELTAPVLLVLLVVLDEVSSADDEG